MDNLGSMHSQSTVSHILWNDLEVRHQLGEGASGVIHQAQWQSQPVALITVPSAAMALPSRMRAG